MRTLRNNFKMTKLSNHDKIAIWCVLSWLLLGSLRVSELLGSSKKKYEFDTMKTLRWDDVEILHESEGAKKVAVIRLHLRATKTEKTAPSQVVEIPHTTGLLCPYIAFWAWIKT